MPKEVVKHNKAVVEVGSYLHLSDPVLDVESIEKMAALLPALLEVAQDNLVSNPFLLGDFLHG